jgi:hypothetical protein
MEIIENGNIAGTGNDCRVKQKDPNSVRSLNSALSEKFGADVKKDD